jgi:hypothetical protein
MDNIIQSTTLHFRNSILLVNKKDKTLAYGMLAALELCTQRQLWPFLGSLFPKDKLLTLPLEPTSVLLAKRLNVSTCFCTISIVIQFGTSLFKFCENSTLFPHT